MSVFETVFDCDRLYFWKYSNGNDNRNLSKNKCRWKTMFFVNLAMKINFNLKKQHNCCKIYDTEALCIFKYLEM